LRKIGVYGGTFDPVHHGHLILAREAFETLGLAKVIFVPAAAAPGKDPPLADGKARLLMLQAAVQGESMFAINDCELRRPPPSYTIDTIEQMRALEPHGEIYYLIGEDNLPTLTEWHRFHDLKKLVRFVVLDRTGSNAKHSYQIVNRRIDISATEVRNRVASGQSIRYLVPETVEQIIRQQNLYRELAK
jgi:nicotinate-nucleotide adenylyltransferase